MTEDITKLIEEAITKNTFSLEAVKAIQDMRTDYAKVKVQLEESTKNLKFTQDSLTKEIDESTSLSHELDAWKLRESVLAEREKKCMETEIMFTYEQQRSQENRDLVHMFLKNSVIRKAVVEKIPVVRQSFTQTYDNGGQKYQASGDYVEEQNKETVTLETQE